MSAARSAIKGSQEIADDLEHEARWVKEQSWTVDYNLMLKAAAEIKRLQQMGQADHADMLAAEAEVERLKDGIGDMCSCRYAGDRCPACVLLNERSGFGSGRAS